MSFQPDGPIAVHGISDDDVRHTASHQFQQAGRARRPGFPLGTKVVEGKRHYNRVCVHEEKYVIYDQLARGSDVQQDNSYGPNREILLPKNKYQLVVKRLAREKWMGWTREDLRKQTASQFRDVFMQTLFGGIPFPPKAGDRFRLVFVADGLSGDKQTNDPDNIKRVVWDGEEDFSKVVGKLKELKDADGLSEWIVFREFREIYIRDGRDITWTLPWTVQSSVPSLNKKPDKREIATIFDGISILNQFFPQERQMTKTLWATVPRYGSEEWLKISGFWRTRIFDAADEDGLRGRVAFFYNFLWRLDDNCINVYPAGWNPKDVTYEQWHEALKEQQKGRYQMFDTPQDGLNIAKGGMQSSPRKGASQPQESSAAAEATSTSTAPTDTRPLSKETDRSRDGGQGDGDDEDEDEDEDDEPRRPKSAANPDTSPSRKASSKYCEEEEGLCGTELTALDAFELKEHQRMHKQGRCKISKLCHTPVALMNKHELAIHKQMHADMAANKMAKHPEPRKVLKRDYQDEPECPYHEYCHADLKTVRDLEKHQDMHTDRRCYFPGCLAPVGRFDDPQYDEHIAMHAGKPEPPRTWPYFEIATDSLWENEDEPKSDGNGDGQQLDHRQDVVSGDRNKPAGEDENRQDTDSDGEEEDGVEGDSEITEDQAPDFDADEWTEGLCHWHPECRTPISQFEGETKLDRENKAKHKTMHHPTANICGDDNCGARLDFMNERQQRRHRLMHDGAEDKQKLQKFHGEDFRLWKLEKSGKYCSYNEKCKVKLNELPASDQKRHIDMHTADRCTDHDMCHTPLTFFGEDERTAHHVMHIDAKHIEDPEALEAPQDEPLDDDEPRTVRPDDIPHHPAEDLPENHRILSEPEREQFESNQDPSTDDDDDSLASLDNPDAEELAIQYAIMEAARMRLAQANNDPVVDHRQVEDANRDEDGYEHEHEHDHEDEDIPDTPDERRIRAILTGHSQNKTSLQRAHGKMLHFKEVVDYNNEARRQRAEHAFDRRERIQKRATTRAASQKVTATAAAAARKEPLDKTERQKTTNPSPRKQRSRSGDNPNQEINATGDSRPAPQPPAQSAAPGQGPVTGSSNNRRPSQTSPTQSRGTSRRKNTQEQSPSKSAAGQSRAPATKTQPKTNKSSLKRPLQDETGEDQTTQSAKRSKKDDAGSRQKNGSKQMFNIDKKETNKMSGKSPAEQTAANEKKQKQKTSTAVTASTVPGQTNSGRWWLEMSEDDRKRHEAASGNWLHTEQQKGEREHCPKCGTQVSRVNRAEHIIKCLGGKGAFKFGKTCSVYKKLADQQHEIDYQQSRAAAGSPGGAPEDSETDTDSEPDESAVKPRKGKTAGNTKVASMAKVFRLNDAAPIKQEAHENTRRHGRGAARTTTKQQSRAKDPPAEKSTAGKSKKRAAEDESEVVPKKRAKGPASKGKKPS